MANAIKLKKGLDIPVEGHAEARIVDARACEYYALVPDDFHGIVPKVLVKPGDKVKIGSPLMCDKNNPVLQFVSPVSGEVAAVNRGERRKVLNVTVKSDGKMESVEVSVPEIASLTGEQIKEIPVSPRAIFLLRRGIRLRWLRTSISSSKETRPICRPASMCCVNLRVEMCIWVFVPAVR